MTDTDTSAKKEIVYTYPSKNTHSSRGNQNVGWLEYRMPSQQFAVFFPIPANWDEFKEFFGANADKVFGFRKLIRGIGNDWDNKVPAMIAADRKAGKSDQEIADALQKYADEYEVNAPRASASAETKRKASIVSDAEAAGLTEDDIRAAIKALTAKKAKK